MANYKDLKPGVEVWIKEPKNIYAKVVGPRPGDADLPPEDQTWQVTILSSTQYLPPDHLELANPPKDPNAPHQYMSKEWMRELAAFNDSAARYLADNSDTAAMRESIESLRKLGFIKQK